MLRVYEKWIDYNYFSKDAWLGKAQVLENQNMESRAIAAYNFLLKLVDHEKAVEIEEKIIKLKNKG